MTRIPDITISCQDSDSGPWSMTMAEYLGCISADIEPDSDESKIAALAVGQSVVCDGGLGVSYTITRSA